MGLFGFVQDTYSKVVVGAGNVISNVVKKGSGKTTVSGFKKSTVGNVLGKAAAVAVVVGGAVAGGAAVRAAGGVKAVATKVATSGAAKKVATSILTNPTGALKTSAKGLAAAAFVAGGGLALAKPLFTGVKKATQTAIPVLTGQEKITGENVGSVAKTLGAALGIGAVATAGGYLAKELFFDKEGNVVDSAGIPITATNPMTPQTVYMEEQGTTSSKISKETGQGQKISHKVNIKVSQSNKNNSYNRKRSKSVKYIKRAVYN